jgi:fatty-acyl-CoA synthase
MPLIQSTEGLTVAGVLTSRATVDPESPFVLYGDEVVTFGQLESRSEALAASMANLGIEQGDRIALVLPACPEFVIALFAAAKLGVVAVPLNPRLAVPELQYMLRHSEAVLAVSIETLDDTDYLQLFENLMPQLPELQYLVTVGEEDLWYDDRIFQFEDALSAGDGRDFAAPALDPDQSVFTILYTSGVTGKPKGVELTHGALLKAAEATSTAVGLTAGDCIVGVDALFHVFGLGPGVLGALVSGASLALQDGFDAAATIDLIERHGATVQYGVPTLFATQLRVLLSAEPDLSTLRLGLAAGAPVSDDLVRRVGEELGCELLVAYSLTETGSTVSVTRPDDPADKRWFTVGRPVARTEVRILEGDGTELPVESVGEIAVRGPGLLTGYYRQPVETARSFDQAGFFLTGDLGMLDEEGFLHLVGRRKTVIIRGGFNVHPREVEDRLGSHPAVDEAAVVGVPDEILGEAICACIVPQEGAIVTGDEIRDWCRVTLADYKVPDVVRFLDEFPRTGTGKIRRIELARQVQGERDGRRD